ncbi:hypothetical protein MMC13_005454 [Lambiella insularis]|nr:hypothetical protein [Lambiella insularis]
MRLGLRFLPSYAKSLGGDYCSDGSTDPVPRTTDSPLFPTLHKKYHCRNPYRMPDDPEPGHKTLKRVAYLSRDFVHGFVFGNTSLDIGSWMKQVYFPLSARDHPQRHVQGVTSLPNYSTDLEKMEDSYHALEVNSQCEHGRLLRKTLSSSTEDAYIFYDDPRDEALVPQIKRNIYGALNIRLLHLEPRPGTG